MLSLQYHFLADPGSGGLRPGVGWCAAAHEIRVSQPGRRHLGPPCLLAASSAARGTLAGVAAGIDRGIRLGLEPFLLRPAARARVKRIWSGGSDCVPSAGPGSTPAPAGMNVYLFSSLGRIGPCGGRHRRAFDDRLRVVRHCLAGGLAADLCPRGPASGRLAGGGGGLGRADGDLSGIGLDGRAGLGRGTGLVLLAVFLRQLTAGLSQGHAAACRSDGGHGAAGLPRRGPANRRFPPSPRAARPARSSRPAPGGRAMSREGREQKRPRRDCKVQSANLPLKIRNLLFAIELSPFLFGAHTFARAGQVCSAITVPSDGILAAGSTCPAATPPARENAAESGELRFRRVYFPEGMKDWPKGNEKYLPMDGRRVRTPAGGDPTDTLPARCRRPPSASSTRNTNARLKGQTCCKAAPRSTSRSRSPAPCS